LSLVAAQPPFHGYDFGYISNELAQIVPVSCIGGVPILAGAQPGYTAPSITPPNNSGCSFRIDQTVSNTWNSGSQPNVQVNAVIVNNGNREITSIEISAAQQASSLTSIWSVSTQSNGNFGLPSWSPSLSAGASVSFGYVAQTSQPINFETVEVTCF